MCGRVYMEANQPKGWTASVIKLLSLNSKFILLNLILQWGSGWDFANPLSAGSLLGLPTTGLDRSWKTGGMRMDTLFLFAHSPFPRHSSNRSVPQQQQVSPISSFLCHNVIMGLQTHQHQSAGAPQRKSEPSSMQPLLQASRVRQSQPLPFVLPALEVMASYCSYYIFVTSVFSFCLFSLPIHVQLILYIKFSLLK